MTPAQASTFNIANGDVVALVKAFNTANSNNVADSINLAGNGLYILTTINNGENGLPLITSNITLNGNGATITRASNAPNFRIFQVAANGTLRLNNLTLSNGQVSPGGAIYNVGGTLILNHSTVTGNLAYGTIQGVTGIAGGIWSSGTLTLNSSTVSHNSATGGIEGNTGNTGGIANSGIATLNNSIVSGNGAGTAGGVFNSGTLTLNNSTVSNNAAPMFDGGGIYNSGILILTGSTVRGNFAIEEGGGIYNTGSNTIVTNSTISSNIARDGGGIWNQGGMTLNDTTINYNNATVAGGGIKNEDTLAVNRSTLNGNISNSSGGGLYNNGGVATLNNSTVTSNTAHFGGGLWGGGGGGQMTLNHCTISENSATDTFGSGYNGGGLLNASSQTVTLKNTILASNTAQSQGPDCFNLGILTSQGHNLVGNNTGCGFNPATGDQVGTSINPIDPGLGPLQDNSGSTQTRALLSNSPAIDAVAPASCIYVSGGLVTTDQRGQVRPADGNGDGQAICDIGAYEFYMLRVAKTASANSIRVGQTVTYTYQIENMSAVTLTNMTAIDDRLGVINLSSSTLAPGAITTNALTYTPVTADLPGPLINTFVVKGTTQPTDTIISATTSASVNLISQQYLPLIFKAY